MGNFAQDQKHKSMKKIFIGILSILLFGCGNSKVEEGIKSSLEKAYYESTRVKDTYVLYNEDADTKTVVAVLPTMLESHNFQIELKAENIEVSNITDDGADIMYDLVMVGNGQEKKESINMQAKKIGGEWKFDARNFFGGLKESLSKKEK